MWEKGVDVWVELDGHTHVGVVVKDEGSGWVLCDVLTDPEFDYGTPSARVMPVQTVMARTTNVTPRNTE